MRLIDADGLDPETLAGCGPMEIKEILNGTPTADAKPVVYAHWEEFEVVCVVANQCGTNWGSKMRKVRCSACGETNKHYTPPYCPHCGAKMDDWESVIK